MILDQTPAPGFEIPNPDSCTVPELLELVAPKGAEILVNGIRNRIFAPPVKDAGWRAAEGGDLIHAAKIKPEDRHINWASWTWTDINRRNRVLGPLWSKALVLNDSPDDSPSFKRKRIIFTKMEEVEPLRGSDRLALIPGVPFTDATLPVQPQEGKGLYVFTRDGKLLRIHEMKVEGEQAADGLKAALKARMMSSRTFHSDDSHFTVFHNPLQ